MYILLGRKRRMKKAKQLVQTFMETLIHDADEQFLSNATAIRKGQSWKIYDLNYDLFLIQSSRTSACRLNTHKLRKLTGIDSWQELTDWLNRLEFVQYALDKNGLMLLPSSIGYPGRVIVAYKGSTPFWMVYPSIRNSN